MSRPVHRISDLHDFNCPGSLQLNHNIRNQELVLNLHNNVHSETNKDNERLKSEVINKVLDKAFIKPVAMNMKYVTLSGPSNESALTVVGEELDNSKSMFCYMSSMVISLPDQNYDSHQYHLID